MRQEARGLPLIVAARVRTGRAVEPQPHHLRIVVRLRGEVLCFGCYERREGAASSIPILAVEGALSLHVLRDGCHGPSSVSCRWGTRLSPLPGSGEIWKLSGLSDRSIAAEGPAEAILQAPRPCPQCPLVSRPHPWERLSS